MSDDDLIKTLARDNQRVRRENKELLKALTSADSREERLRKAIEEWEGHRGLCGCESCDLIRDTIYAVREEAEEKRW